MLGNIRKRWGILLFFILAVLMYAGIFYQRFLESGEYHKGLFALTGGMAVLTLLVWLCPEKWKENFILPFFRFLIEKRYVVCVILFVVLVVFQISGSSINMIDAYTGENAANGDVSRLLFGHPQAIRSDEWGVNTEYHLAQVNSEEFFPVINKQIGMDGQNMLLACNSPVWHISLIGKPQTWGYFFLGASRGLSWFWWFRFFALLLGSYEMGVILSKGKRKLSVFLAAAVVFSPLYSWWYSTTLFDLAISGQWLFVGFYYFFFASEYRRKLAAAVLFLMSAIGYCVALYPAMQVPLGYLLVILILYYLIADRKRIVFGKKEFAAAAAVVAVFLFTMAMFLKDTYPDMLKVMNTAYPGHREAATGGFSPATWFYYVIGCILPFKDVPFLNNSEVSMVPLFLVAVVVLLVVFLRKGKGRERALAALLGIYGAFLLSMYVIPYPSAFLKITLMSFTTVTRNIVVVGMICLYLIVLILSRRKEIGTEFAGVQEDGNADSQKNGSIVVRLAAGIISAVIMLAAAFVFGARDYISLPLLAVCVLIFVLLEQFLLGNRQRELLAGLLITVVLTSLRVNPLTCTADSVTENELVEAAQEIDREQQGNWLVLDTLIEQNVLAANGFHVINAVQYEPNLDYWHSLDEEKDYEEVYNRYAHVTAKLVSEDTGFEINQADWINFCISENDLEKAQVDYLVIKGELDGQEERMEKISFCKNGGYSIYRVREKR